MSNSPTVKAPSTPARAGTLGISYPSPPRSGLGPYEALIELTRRTGDSFELVSNEFGFYIWNATVGDSAGEGATREEALEAALEAV